MTTTETLIQERLDDLSEEQPGTLRATCDHLLGAAWDALYERQHNDADGLVTALSHIDAAVELLTAYQKRLQALREQDGKEYVAKWAPDSTTHQH